MNLSVIAQIAEIMAAVGVIVSLIFVGVQVRANTRATRSAAAHDAMSGMREFYMMLGANEQASKVWYRGMTDPAELSPEEMIQFFSAIHSALLAFQTSYTMTAERTLDPEIRDSVTSSLIAVKDLPGFEKYWSERREYFKTGFRDYVDDLMERKTLSQQTIYPSVKPEG